MKNYIAKQHDPTACTFDVSGFLASRIGFLPVPIVITEPAIGYGGGALLYFYDKLSGEATTGENEDNSAADDQPGHKRRGPPDFSSVHLDAGHSGNALPRQPCTARRDGITMAIFSAVECADHAEAYGAFQQIYAANPKMMKDPTVKKWHDWLVTKSGESAYRFPNGKL